MIKHAFTIIMALSLTAAMAQKDTATFKVSRKKALEMAEQAYGKADFKITKQLREGRRVWACFFSETGGDGVSSSRQNYWIIIDRLTGEVLEKRGVTTR